MDEDSAIQMLEDIVATLQRLEPSEKDRFLRYVQMRASQAKSAEEREAIEALASNIDLES